jgi:NAD(P)H-flavin reductase/ferredoxin
MFSYRDYLFDQSKEITVIWFKKKLPYDALINGNEYQLSCNKTILEGLLSSNATVPYNCQVGACKKCMLKICNGEVKSLIDLGYCLTQEQIDDGYVLACQAMPKSNIIAEFNESTESSKFSLPIKTKVVSIEKLSTYIYRVWLPYVEIVEAGQSFELLIPELDLNRYYSVSSINKGVGVAVDVALKSVGGCSSWLCNDSNIGKAVYIKNLSPKFGDFTESTDQIIAVAGGSALGMILSVLEDYLKSNDNVRVDLIHAVRFREDGYDENRIKKLQKKYKKFNFYGLLSRQDLDSNGYFQGKAPDFLKALFSDNKVSKVCNFLMCGSDRLVKPCVSVLKCEMVESQRCEIESFGA